jgi:hypothetical protein
MHRTFPAIAGGMLDCGEEKKLVSKGEGDRLVRQSRLELLDA